MNDATTIERLPGFVRQANIKLEVARDFTIQSQTEAELAAEELRAIKTLAKKVEEARKAEKEPHLQAGKAVDAAYKAPLDLLTQAEGVLKSALGAWQASETARIAAEKVELDRIADETRKQLEAQGLGELAAMVVSAAPVAETKLDGIGSRKAWKARLIDKAAFVRAALDRPDLMALIEVSESGLNKVAAATKGSIPIPGAEVYEDKTIVARAA